MDRRFRDQAYAEAKLADVVGGRLAILETLLECRSAREAQERLAALGNRFEWMRIVVEETSPG